MTKTNSSGNPMDKRERAKLIGKIRWLESLIFKRNAIIAELEEELQDANDATLYVGWKAAQLKYRLWHVFRDQTGPG